ncbi:MAG: serine hydrolase, partial [Bacillota bacterium]|nr:serine hydrolase [Bacillota bacterium]
EEYEDIRKLIIFGNWGNDLISKNNMFSSISEDEIIYILDKYASLKNLEIRELNTHYKNIDSKSFDALNRLMTSNILNEDFLIEPLNIDLIKDAINKTKKISQNKQLISEKINIILKKYDEKLRDKKEIDFNLVHGQTGATILFNGKVTNHPASIIKTFYLYVFLKEVESGIRSLDDRRVFLNGDKYNTVGNKITGSGILQNSKANVTYTWGELLSLMIIESDNVATSMVMQELETKNIDEWSKISGLENTDITGPIYTVAGRATKSSAEDLTKVLYLLDTLPTELRNFALK